LVNPEYRATQAEDEISSADIIRFFRRNAKFIGLVTLGLWVMAIAFSLLTPKQYQKQVTLLIRFTPIPLAVGSVPGLENNQAAALAVEFLRRSKLDKITTKAQTNPETQEIDVKLQSPNASSLSSAVPKVVSQLTRKFQEPVSQSLETNLGAVEQALAKQKEILPQLERTIDRLPPSNTPKRQALEAQRAELIISIASLNFDKGYLEQAQKNLSDITAKIISVKILRESKVEPISSTKQLVVIAVIASFMAAVIAAIIRDQVVRLQDERSKEKFDRSLDL
jgi:hypothetical protein